MGVRAPGGGAPGVQVMAGERGTAGSPAGSNEMIDVKKGTCTLQSVRHLARQIRKIRKIRVTPPRGRPAALSRRPVAERGRRDICVRSPDRAARLVAGQAPASADDFPDAEPRVHLRGEESGGANLR